MIRLWVSARRSPVAQASYCSSESASGCTLRSLQHRSGSRANRSLPYSASCSATVCFGRDREQVDRKGGLDGVSGADGLGEVVAGVEEHHVDARSDLGRQVREDRVAHRRGDAEALTERRDRPLDDVLGGGQLELGAHVGHELAQLLGCAAGGVGPAEVACRGGGGGGHEPTSCPDCPAGRSDLAVHLDRERTQARAALPGAAGRLVVGLVRPQVLVAAVGAVEGNGTFAHVRPPPMSSGGRASVGGRACRDPRRAGAPRRPGPPRWRRTRRARGRRGTPSRRW